MGWLYFSIILHLVGQWWQDPNFSHGFFVPAFALFVLWQDRPRLAGFVPAASIWGLGIIVFALCVLVIGVLGAQLFLSRFSLLLLIAGLIVSVRGWRVFRAVLLPLAFFLLVFPAQAIV